MSMQNQAAQHKTLITTLVLALVVVGTLYFLEGNGPTRDQNGSGDAAGEELPGYFEDRLTALGVEDIGQPIEGFDAGILMQAFPGFKNEDFKEVQTLEGRYTLAEEGLLFERDKDAPVSSAEKMIVTEGYATLLENVSRRLDLAATSTASVDVIISLLDLAERIETRIDEGASALGAKIVPVELLEDSRCPQGVQCIQAGTVRVRARVTTTSKEGIEIFTLGKAVALSPDDTEATLILVLPERQAGKAIGAFEYRFVFQVQKILVSSY